MLGQSQYSIKSGTETCFSPDFSHFRAPSSANGRRVAGKCEKFGLAGYTTKFIKYPASNAEPIQGILCLPMRLLG
jgi:hypothetical protein